MSILAIFYGSFCSHDAYTGALLEKTGLEHVSEKILIKSASERSGISEQKIASAFSAKTSIFNKFTHEKERSLAYIKLILAEHLLSECTISGFPSLLIPSQISHVLKVCFIAPVKNRVARAVQEVDISEKEAMKAITRHDTDISQWFEQYKGLSDPWSPDLYDIVIPTDKVSIEEAEKLITRSLEKTVLQATEESRQAVDDFSLRAKVEVALAQEGHNVKVSINQGHVRLTIEKHVLMLNRLEDELKEIVQKIEGVQSIKATVGKEFYQSDIYRKYDFTMPSKVLLVDDEREFVQTLSERLEMRDMGSAIAYDGESALDIVSRDEPEVMILDLKMPGIDGIEVLKRVKQTNPDIEVIILTGHGSDKDRDICLELGAFAYLQKPVDINLLSQTLKEANEKIRNKLHKE